MCRSRFDDILVKFGDPRIERWMHKLVDAMQERIEQEAVESARMREAQASHGASSSSGEARQEDDAVAPELHGPTSSHCQRTPTG